MCIKNIYHNVYSDGTRDVTEKVDTCRSGYMCSDPAIREFDRKINCTKLQLSGSPGRGVSPLKDRQPTPYYAEYESDRERRRRKRSSKGIYVDGDRATDYGIRKKEKHTPTSPGPIAIPKMRRASTMPTADYYPERREARSRPVVIDNSNRRNSFRQESAAVPVGPVDVLYNYGSPSRKTRDSYLEPPRAHRRSSRSPVEVYATDDEQERRRRRRSTKATVSPEIPGGISADAVYGSSPYGGSYGSSYGSTAGNSGHNAWTPLPVVVTNSSSPSGRAGTPPVRKELRWEDELRAQQNARISTRPKLSRSATVTGAGTGAVHPQGILKNTGAAAPAVQRDVPEELYSSLRGLGIEERETSAQRKLRQEREQDREYNDRLRNRFSMPPRRFAVEKGSRSGRRTEVFYPEEGAYRSY